MKIFWFIIGIMQRDKAVIGRRGRDRPLAPQSWDGMAGATYGQQEASHYRSWYSWQTPSSLREWRPGQQLQPEHGTGATSWPRVLDWPNSYLQGKQNKTTKNSAIVSLLSYTTGVCFASLWKASLFRFNTIVQNHHLWATCILFLTR